MTMLADTGLWTTAWFYLSWVVPFLFVLGIVVFVHEMGHFLVARYYGVSVETFSIGFGPEIGGFYDSRGTRWRVAWIPLGGYVKFKGDENAASVPGEHNLESLSEEERKGNFHAKPVGQRAAVVAAGPIANFLFAIVIFMILFLANGKQILEPRLSSVEENGPAAEAGLKAGDLIREINGTTIESFDEVQRIVMLNAETELSISVQRDGELRTFQATPELTDTTDRFGNTVQIGLLGMKIEAQPEDLKTKEFGPVEAFTESVAKTYFWLKQPLIFIEKLVVGQASSDQVRGVAGIAQLSREVATLGFDKLLEWTAIISINIGLINLFPIPVLDGGHLLFYGIEAIRGRPLRERTMEIGFRIGFALVIMLMLFALRNDVIHILRQTG